MTQYIFVSKIDFTKQAAFVNESPISRSRILTNIINVKGRTCFKVEWLKHFNPFPWCQKISARIILKILIAVLGMFDVEAEAVKRR